MDQKNVLTEDGYILLRKVIKLLLVVVTSMAFVRLYEMNYMQALSDFGLSLILIYGHSIANKKNEKRFFLIARITFLMAFSTIFILMFHTKEQATLLVWLSTAMYALFMLFGRREGWIWFMAIVSIIVVLYIYNNALLGISGTELIVWIVNIVIILYIVDWYETTKEASTQRLLEMQHALADKVEEKTYELQELNRALKEKVQIEVEKNREKENQLLAQSRLVQMGEMLSMIAHQWRQPLAAISATSATLELKAGMDRLSNTDVQNKAHNISNYAQHLSKTIDDFRDFFKPNRSKEEASFDIIATDVLSIIHNLLKNKSITVVTDFQDHTKMQTYSNELKQVVLNLIKNAEDVLLEREISNPEIIICTLKENDSIVLTVEDNGGGIDKTIIEKIFDPYFSTKKNKDGTGLGLYMSKIIVEDHCEGKLSVSDGQNGAVFKISLKGGKDRKNR